MRLVLINVIYFKGMWFYVFKLEKIYYVWFFIISDRENVVEVEMMFRILKYSYFVDKENNCKVIEFFYSGDSVVMLFVFFNEINGVF